MAGSSTDRHRLQPSSEATLDFTFRGSRFRIDEHQGWYRLFVDPGPGDGTTRDAARAVEEYCRQFLTPAQAT